MNTIDQVAPRTQISASAEHTVQPPRNIKEAGQQFESLLIAELLRGTHTADGGWLGSGEDSASSCAMGVAEESLAQALASHGGFGIGELVTKSLARPETT